MIDLHCHLLPSVDDGAQSEVDSLSLFKLAIDDGISHMVLTPHVQPGRYENTANSLKAPFERLQQLIEDQQLNIKLSLGGEVRLCAEVLGLFASNNLPFIGEYDNKKVMLLELPHNGIPPGSDKLVDWLIQRDILPMIAHPERNKSIMADINKAQPFLDRGCLFQLTAMSVTGDFGDKAYHIAQQFLEQRWATIIASDAHNINRRPPILSKAFKYVTDNYGAALAEQLLIETPGKIIENR